MTRSELHAICTGGFATIAGSVMAAYILYKVYKKKDFYKYCPQHCYVRIHCNEIIKQMHDFQPIRFNYFEQGGGGYNLAKMFLHLLKIYWQTKWISVIDTFMTLYIKVPANHLLSASVMSAPAALAMSKLFYPETRKSKTGNEVYNMASG